ncbi:MAG: hypothetical protein ACI849_000831 [Patiriisocius sp.]|jgi:hypothetical protein
MATPSTSWSKYALAFYNLENLFDTVNDKNKSDDDFTKKGFKRWDKAKLGKKVQDLGNIIQQIGFKETGHPPVLVGVAEVENNLVLQELIDSEHLKEKGYQFVHCDSKDERGIDTALLYRSQYFKVLTTKAHEVFFIDNQGEKDYTRDILEVKGTIEGQEVYILVNHFPSRREGEIESAPKRMRVAKKNIAIITNIQAEDPQAKIIIMGDFNDDPHSASIVHMVAQGFYNPMELLLTKEDGSLTYKGKWNLFDQIIVSENFLKMHGNTFRFHKAAIFGEDVVKVNEGDYEGYPFRTYAGPKYLGGISDHFPVYSIFKITKQTS